MPDRNHHKPAKPTELAITIAALGHRYATAGEWLCASQIAANLKLLGFDTTGRRLAPRLRVMATVDAPWLERRRDLFGSEYEYRVTHWGRTDISNRLPALARRV
jgi:hypothetical protein